MPDADKIAKESIYLGDAEPQSEDIAVMRTPPHPHNEYYIVPIFVDVLSEGDDAQGAETRGWVIVGEIENALRGQTGGVLGPSLNNASGVLAAWVSGKTPNMYVTDQGRVWVCRMNVTVQGRI